VAVGSAHRAASCLALDDHEFEPGRHVLVPEISRLRRRIAVIGSTMVMTNMGAILWADGEGYPTISRRRNSARHEVPVKSRGGQNAVPSRAPARETVCIDAD